MAGTEIRVGIPIGFPLGGHTTKTKVAEAIEAVARGAKVLDMVINVSRLKSGDRYVRTRHGRSGEGDRGSQSTKSYWRPVI